MAKRGNIWVKSLIIGFSLYLTNIILGALFSLLYPLQEFLFGIMIRLSFIFTILLVFYSYIRYSKKSFFGEEIIIIGTTYFFFPMILSFFTNLATKGFLLFQEVTKNEALIFLLTLVIGYPITLIILVELNRSFCKRLKIPDKIEKYWYRKILPRWLLLVIVFGTALYFSISLLLKKGSEIWPSIIAIWIIGIILLAKTIDTYKKKK